MEYYQQDESGPKNTTGPGSPSGGELIEGLGNIWETVKKMYDPSNPAYRYTPANPKISQYLPHNMLFNWLTGDKEPSGQEIYNHLGERISYPQKWDYRSKEEYDEAVRYYTKQKGIKSVAQAPTVYEQAREDYENSQKRAIINKKLDRLKRKALEASYKARAFEFQDRI
jgi:hypothetical protein